MTDDRPFLERWPILTGSTHERFLTAEERQDFEDDLQWEVDERVCRGESFATIARSCAVPASAVRRVWRNLTAGYTPPAETAADGTGADSAHAGTGGHLDDGGGDPGGSP